MQRLSVRPPEGDLVDTYLLSRNIAHAIVALAADPHATLVEGLLDFKVADIRIQDGDMETSAPLTAEDRKLLREILPDLLPLTITSDASARALFREQWKLHPKAPTWRPYLPTEQDQAKAAFQAVNISSRHLDQMQEWLRRGVLQAFDRHLIPAMKVGLNIYISREDAKRYLKEHGIDTPEPAPELRDESPTNTTESKVGDHRITHHSSEMKPQKTVDDLIDFLIAYNLDRLTDAKDATILDRVIAMFIEQSSTTKLIDFEKISGQGSTIEIHRKWGRKTLDRETIRGRLRRKRPSETPRANATGQ